MAKNHPVTGILFRKLSEPKIKPKTFFSFFDWFQEMSILKVKKEFLADETTNYLRIYRDVSNLVLRVLSPLSRDNTLGMRLRCFYKYSCVSGVYRSLYHKICLHNILPKLIQHYPGHTFNDNYTNNRFKNLFAHLRQLYQ